MPYVRPSRLHSRVKRHVKRAVESHCPRYYRSVATILSFPMLFLCSSIHRSSFLPLLALFLARQGGGASLSAVL